MNLYVVVLLNFLLTALAEGIGIFCITRSRKFIYYSFLCNLLTNPLLNLLLLLSGQWLGQGAYYPCLVLLETMAVLAEAWVYSLLGGVSRRKALWMSLLLNAFSFLLGLVLNLLVS